MSTPVELNRVTVLTPEQWHTLLASADALIPGTAERAAPSALAGFDQWLQRALDARPDLAAAMIPTLAELAADARTGTAAELFVRLADLDTRDPLAVAGLGTIVAGAYTMHPAVLTAIGYPGQGRNPAPFSQATDELATGLLDPVLEAGPVIRSV